MNEYSISLALAYFKEKRENYIIGEIAALLGYNGAQVNRLFEYLIEQKYIDYSDDLITITPKGITFLISKDQDNLRSQSDYFVKPHINPEKALPLDVPYVPRGFYKKIQR